MAAPVASGLRLSRSSSTIQRDVLMEGMQRLEHGQFRLEAQLLEIQQSLEELQHVGIVKGVAKDALTTKTDRADGDNPSYSQEAAYQDQLLEESRKSKATSIQEDYKMAMEKQQGAENELFHACNQARGWEPRKSVHELMQEEEGTAPSDLDSRPKAWMRRQFDNGRFDIVFAGLIFVNAYTMMIMLNGRGQQLGYDLNFEHAPPLDNVQLTAPDIEISETANTIIEVIFIFFFTVELALRLWIRHWAFFTKPWNLLDILLVSVSYIDMASRELPVDLTLFRLLRLLRLTKVLRMIRVMRSFGPLRVLVATMYRSMISLVWSIVLITFVLMMCACLMTSMTYASIKNPEKDYALRQTIWEQWGTTGHALNTLVRWTLTATWPDDAEVLIYGLSPMYGFFVFPFIIVVNFALIRVVTAIFIKETFAAHQKDEEQFLEETLRRDGKTLNSLKNMFRQYDANGDGRLDENEFKNAMEDHNVEEALTAVAITPHEAASLFKLMDHGKGMLTIDEVVAGCMNLRDDSKVDIASVMYESQKIKLQLRGIEEQCKMLAKMGEYNIEQLEYVRQEAHDKTDTSAAI